MTTDDTAARVKRIRARIAEWRDGTIHRDGQWAWVDVGLLCDALTIAEHRLATLEPCYADAQAAAARLLIEREQYDQTLRNAEERAQFAVERADAAERERDQARAELDEHHIAYTALVGARDHEQVARKAAEAQMIRANMRAEAAEDRATRLAALEEAAREIAILWPSDPQLWAWEEVEALVDAVARLAAPPGEGA